MNRLFVLALLSPLIVLVPLTGACKRAHAASASIVVEVTWRGARAAQVEREITMPLEDALTHAGLSGIEHVTSTSRTGAARVRARLAPDSDAQDAIAVLRTMILTISKQLPLDADVPVLRRESGAVRPAFRFVATSKEATLVQNTDVLRALGHQMEGVLGVVRVEVERGALPEWLVDVDDTRAQALGLTALDVADAVRDAVEAASTVDATALSQTTVRTPPDGAALRVADVARVELGTRPSSDAWPPNGSAPSLVVYVDAAAPADIEERIAGETMHARSVLGPGFDFQHAAISAREGVAVIVTGSEHGVVRDAARALRALAAATKGVRDVDAPLADAPDLVVDVDRTRAAALGVPVAVVSRASALAMGGEVVHPRVLDAPPVRVRTGAGIDALRSAHVRATSGASVPLDSVATLRAASGPEHLERLDRMPASWLCAGVDVDGTQDDVAAALRTAMATAPLPAGVSVVVERGCSH